MAARFTFKVMNSLCRTMEIVPNSAVKFTIQGQDIFKYTIKMILIVFCVYESDV